MKSIKKLLAVVLAIALIVSCFAINASAARSLCYIEEQPTASNNFTLTLDPAPSDTLSYTYQWLYVDISSATSVISTVVDLKTLMTGGKTANDANNEFNNSNSTNYFEVLDNQWYSPTGNDYTDSEGIHSDEKDLQIVMNKNLIKSGDILIFTIKDANGKAIDDLQIKIAVDVLYKDGCNYICSVKNVDDTRDIQIDSTTSDFIISDIKIAQTEKTSNTTNSLIDSNGNALSTKTGMYSCQATAREGEKSLTVTSDSVYVYPIKEVGTDLSWTKGSTESLTISSNADFSNYADKVTVDGKSVDKTNYTAAEGSTKITFGAAYLSTLSLGDHKVVIYSKNGIANGTISIKEIVTPTPEEKTTEKPAEVEAVADTADTNAIGAFAALTALSAAGFVTLKKKEN